MLEQLEEDVDRVREAPSIVELQRDVFTCLDQALSAARERLRLVPLTCTCGFVNQEGVTFCASCAQPMQGAPVADQAVCKDVPGAGGDPECDRPYDDSNRFCPGCRKKFE